MTRAEPSAYEIPRAAGTAALLANYPGGGGAGEVGAILEPLVSGRGQARRAHAEETLVPATRLGYRAGRVLFGGAGVQTAVGRPAKVLLQPVVPAR